MEKTSVHEIAYCLKAIQKVIDAPINKISTDSRNISSKTLFIALKGEHFDGHDFVSEVIQKGCPAAVVSHYIEGVPTERQILVEDTLKAYGTIGAFNRSKFKGIVIGITGSAGKTTTKEEIAFLLSHFGRCYASKGNHNNMVGVPETLCNMDMKAEYAVIEMGMSAPGEISYLSKLVSPDIAVITNIYPMHIEFFKNLEGIARAKAEIFEGFKDSSGIAIYNEDSDYSELLGFLANAYTDNVITYGKYSHPLCAFTTANEGIQYKYNAWCALTVINAMGLDENKAAKYIKEFEALPGRGKKYELTFDKGKYTLIDDSYSGQPESMILAIKNLHQSQTKGRKIVVLGKMAELGQTSKARHEEVGKILAASNINIIVGVCPEMKDMLAQLPTDKEQYYFDNKDKVAEFLLNKLLQNEDTVLIKGARYSSQMYKVAEQLIEQGIKK